MLNSGSRRGVGHLKVAAHAIGNKATRIAAEAGADPIEHAHVVPAPA